MKKILEKIIKEAEKITNEKQQKAFLLKEIEKHYDEIPFEDIGNLIKEVEAGIEHLKIQVEKMKNKKNK